MVGDKQEGQVNISCKSTLQVKVHWRWTKTVFFLGRRRTDESFTITIATQNLHIWVRYPSNPNAEARLYKCSHREESLLPYLSLRGRRKWNTKEWKAIHCPVQKQTNRKKSQRANADSLEGGNKQLKELLVVHVTVTSTNLHCFSSCDVNSAKLDLIKA